MPLRLVTGPVNSGKAAEVLDGVPVVADTWDPDELAACCRRLLDDPQLSPALADELAGLLECDSAAAAEQLRTIDDGPLAYRLGELCLSTGLNETALVWWNLAVIAGSAEAEALLKRFASD